MVRYMMSFSVKESEQETARRIIREYFEKLYRAGPGGMRSQCYSDEGKDGGFVHIKSFVRDSVARQHFRSALFTEYMNRLSAVTGEPLSFTRLSQEKTFESIY